MCFEPRTLKTKIMKNSTIIFGVVVGRFQTHYLHDGHISFLDYVSANSEMMLILIGCTESVVDTRNPLDFEARKAMIKARYPKAYIDRIDDMDSDELWSQSLDKQIGRYASKNDVITLYGSRDSFISSYHGKYETDYFAPVFDDNATAIRSSVVLKDSMDFREGIIYASRRMYPTSFQTVDIIIEDETGENVVVGKKKNSKNWCFPGGFVDPKDNSLELAAKREAYEEVRGIEIDDIKYQGSYRIDDYRYRSSDHKIMTALFTAKYIFGRIEAGDDLDEVKWISVGELVDCLNDNHKCLANEYLKTKQTKQK